MDRPQPGRLIPYGGALVVAAALLLLILKSGALGGQAPASGGDEWRQKLAAVVRTRAIEDGMPTELAACVGDRASRLTTFEDVSNFDTHAKRRLTDVAQSAARSCARALGPAAGIYPPEESTAVGMTAEWRRFSDAVDRTCAGNFNSALQAEGIIESLAKQKDWSDEKSEKFVQHSWSRWQLSTYRETGRLGQPPAERALFRRWRANVGLRGHLMASAGDAVGRGNWSGYHQIFGRIYRLKDRADLMGKRFGLRICTSN